MATKKKLLEAAAGSAGGAGGLNVEDVFSTDVWNAVSGTKTITNGIDFANEGGLLWIKMRNDALGHYLFDTERGTDGTYYYKLKTEDTSAQTSINALTSLNSDGYTLPQNIYTYGDSYDYVGWSFRKAPKFFDVVTYTGDGTNGRQIPHNLGSNIGMVICKGVDVVTTWAVKHKDRPTDEGQLNSTNAFAGYGNFPTSFAGFTDTYFTVNAGGSTNANGYNYVAYLFAHNDGDGEFGSTADQDIIKCGSYNGNGSTQTINLGWEPQFVIIKKAAGTGDEGWVIQDVMRGMHAAGATHDDRPLFANSATAEASINNLVGPTATGFFLERGDGAVNASGSSYIYIAIRRGPMAVPTDATDVFNVSYFGETSGYGGYLGAPVDMALRRSSISGTADWQIASRLTKNILYTNLTNAEVTGDNRFENNKGVYTTTGTNTDQYFWMWQRRPSFCDVVAYTGNGVAVQEINHNLGVAPEMIWVKCRSNIQNWPVRVNNDFYRYLNQTEGDGGSTFYSAHWASSDPTDTIFHVTSNDNVGGLGKTYIAYLFASLDGVSKVGSYTGTATLQTIDCGFSSGARFVMIKRTDSTGDWVVFDTERGITSGDDPSLDLNNTNAEDASYNPIDPNSSGFNIRQLSGSDLNVSGATYIFYAIA